MSESDDTDDLLLIPPDFFSVHSEPDPPYYSIVDSLIQQVSKLQDRIETIESTSDVSLVGSSLDNSISMSYNRKYNSSENVYQPSSTQSTPQKPHTQFKLNSLPSSPNVDRYSPRRNLKPPQRVNRSTRSSEMLNEIDSFISNVRTIQSSQTARNLEKAFATNELLNESRKVDHVKEQRVGKESTWRCGDNVESIPNYNFGLREPSSPTSSDSSSDSTQPTVYDKLNDKVESKQNENALNALNMQRNLKKRGINTLSDSIGLVSLANIWGPDNSSQSPSKLHQKLQEEKLRRQHCEQLIQDLQSRNLELQQKLAVAVTVDDSKNSTIQQFKEALKTVSSRMDQLKEEKKTWDQEVNRLKKQHEIEIESFQQKITYYEKEASKALNLAHGNQEKITPLEKRCSDLQGELELIESKFKDLQENYLKELERNKQMADIISRKEIELNENKTLLNEARAEVAQSRKAVEVCQSDFAALKNDYMKLQSDLKQQKGAAVTLTEQRKKLTNDLESFKTNEKLLKDALEDTKAKLESTKLELRNYYQGQLEIIVDNKRKEMQTQLDQERQNSMEEFKKKELSMAKTAANHIKEISEKCALEIKLLEEKHREEVRLYQMQISQLRKETEHLQAKLAQLPEKRAQIARQLQKAMESQFNEALKMIGSSPTSFVEPVSTYGNHKNGNFDSVSDYEETPVSSRPKQSESEIQKYINMLLNRPQGEPAPDAPPKEPQGNQQALWQPGSPENLDKDTTSQKATTKDWRKGKPPWK